MSFKSVPYFVCLIPSQTQSQASALPLPVPGISYGESVPGVKPKESKTCSESPTTPRALTEAEEYGLVSDFVDCVLEFMVCWKFMAFLNILKLRMQIMFHV